MRVGRLIRSAVPLIALGAAATVAARRRAQARERGIQLPAPAPDPGPEAAPAPDPEPELEPGTEPPPPVPRADEQMTAEMDALDDLEPSGQASMTDIVDDLLTPRTRPDDVEDATVVDDSER